MSIKQRLRTAEKRIGTSGETPIRFLTTYKNRDGSDGDSYCRVVFPKSGRHVHARRRDDESPEEFSCRIDGLIEEMRAGRDVESDE